MKRILAATDGSAGGRAAVAAAIELAQESGALVTIVCVRRLPAALLGSPLYERALSRELREGRAVIDEATARATAAGLEVESEILSGHAAEEIVRLARLRDVDLIVVGSHGGGRAAALLGSVANHVVRTASRAVLVARPGPGEHRQAA